MCNDPNHLTVVSDARWEHKRTTAGESRRRDGSAHERSTEQIRRDPMRNTVTEGSAVLPIGPFTRPVGQQWTKRRVMPREVESAREKHPGQHRSGQAVKLIHKHDQ